MRHEVGAREGGRDWGFPYTPVLDDYGLDPYEMRVYLRLSRRAGMGGQCWESIAKMADACKMSQQKVKDSLNLLADAQLIRKIKRPGKSDIYELVHESHWVESSHLDALRKGVRSYRESSDSKRRKLYQGQLPSYEVANTELRGSYLPSYEVANTELRGSYLPSYEVANTELRGSYKDLRNTQEVNTNEELPSKSESEGKECFLNNTDAATTQSFASLLKKPDVIARTDIPHEIQCSAPACDNSAFMGNGNIAPDGKVRPFDQVRGVWKSVSSDAWMRSASNPISEFKAWVAQSYEAKRDPRALSNAASEIRNNYERASDLWEAYQASLQPFQQPIQYQAAPDTVHQPRKPIRLSGKR